ncbi:MAG: hypothetical protein IKL40_04215 [Clostridia bacterium]|nr:hypothetical protein [Clostridia bacterium]
MVCQYKFYCFFICLIIYTKSPNTLKGYCANNNASYCITSINVYYRRYLYET